MTVENDNHLLGCALLEGDGLLNCGTVGGGVHKGGHNRIERISLGLSLSLTLKNGMRNF